MSTVIKTYIGIFTFMISIIAMIGLMSATVDSNHARDYHSAVMAEIEDSNFSPTVIAACRDQAREAGYELVIDESRAIKNEDGKVILLEVVLKYQYQIPFFGIDEEQQIRGFVR